MSARIHEADDTPLSTSKTAQFDSKPKANTREPKSQQPSAGESVAALFGGNKPVPRFSREAGALPKRTGERGPASSDDQQKGERKVGSRSSHSSSKLEALCVSACESLSALISFSCGTAVSHQKDVMEMTSPPDSRRLTQSPVDHY